MASFGRSTFQGTSGLHDGLGNWGAVRVKAASEGDRDQANGHPRICHDVYKSDQPGPNLADGQMTGCWPA